MRRIRVILLGCLVAAAASCSMPLLAQHQTERPKLGLALSGGGSHGLAHLGVLKVMEEEGLTPDYISGVSIGSIVGGLYAMGYSADSIVQIFKEFDFGAAMSDRIPENKIIYLEKRHFNNSLLALPVTRRAIKIPSGLISGQQVESGLNHFFWPAAAIDDFTKLPIPFICLAADMVTGNNVVFKNGYLPDVIRASIAVPSVFTPVRTDTAVLVDGGVVRNYAASDLREMGADIVIGSYVSFKGYQGMDLESAYSILKQIGFLSSLADYEEQKQATDILIETDLKGVNFLSFNDVDSIYQKGYREAAKYREQFRRLADSLNTFGRADLVKPLPQVDHYIFDGIRVKGNRMISFEQITGVLGITTGEKVSNKLLEERIELLYGKNWFEKVKYRIVREGTGLILEIDCIERPKAMIYGSLHYDQSLSAGAVIRLSARDIIAPGSVINLDSFIGEYFRLRASLIQFVDKSQKFGIEGVLHNDNTRLPLVPLKSETGPMLSQNLIGSVALSKRLSLNNLMTLSASLENRHLVPYFITGTQIRRLTYDYLRLRYRYQANTLDKKYFPDQGVDISITLTASQLLKATMKTATARSVYYPDDHYSPFSFARSYAGQLSLNTYSSPSERVTLNFGVDLLLSTGVDSVTSGNDFWLLGGKEPLNERSITAIGFHPGQILIRNTGGVRLGTDIEIFTDLHLSIETNLFLLREPDRENGFAFLGGYGIGAGYMTVAGPMRIGIMHGFYDRELLFRNIKGYVSLGFGF